MDVFGMKDGKIVEFIERFDTATGLPAKQRGRKRRSKRKCKSRAQPTLGSPELASLPDSSAAMLARKYVAANVPRLSLLAIDASVSSALCFLSQGR
jgi:hypothetical protein